VFCFEEMRNLYLEGISLHLALEETSLHFILALFEFLRGSPEAIIDDFIALLTRVARGGIKLLGFKVVDKVLSTELSVVLVIVGLVKVDVVKTFVVVEVSVKIDGARVLVVVDELITTSLSRSSISVSMSSSRLW
jgi:hypothetical protein